MLALSVVRIEDLDYPEADDLVRQSLAEGYRFVEPMVARFRSGETRYDKPGEAIFGVRLEGTLVAMGALTPDPYYRHPGVGRVRHVYVSQFCRRQGAGRALLAAIVEEARRHYRLLLLRTQTESAARFYEALGFSAESPSPDATHSMDLEQT